MRRLVGARVVERSVARESGVPSHLIGRSSPARRRTSNETFQCSKEPPREHNVIFSGVVLFLSCDIALALLCDYFFERRPLCASSCDSRSAQMLVVTLGDWDLKWGV